MTQPQPHAQDMSETKKTRSDEPRSAHTRNMMTLVLGLAGARVGMSIGGTIANACIVASKYQDYTLQGDIIMPVWESAKKAAHLENPELKQLYNELKPYIGTSLKGVAIGGALCAVPAAVIGWQRGDRVDHIKDVICKPKDTFHRLSISQEQFDEEYSEPRSAVSCEHAQHGGQVNNMHKHNSL